MKKRFFLTNTFLLLTLLVSACGAQPTPTATLEPTEEIAPDLYLIIIWHQHQPFYATDPDTGLVSAPWVRMHAAKDYVDMAAMLRDYPDIHATFNLTPSLIRQLDALEAGERDIVWALTMIPADQLDDEQKLYILQRFFDVNGRIIARFPRYQELQQMRGGADAENLAEAIDSWTAQDFRDLQVLFNLAWTDPDYLAEAPLNDLVLRGQGFTEADKTVVLDVHARLISEVIPVHRELQDSGQIEVTFTPYAHPILPLLIDTNLAQIAVPDIDLPATRFTHGDDAIEQLERGMALYEEHFGQPPRGMWPAEGSVAQYMVGMVARAGVEWMVTDEGILANSLGLDFTRLAGGVPMNATSLYRPYTAARNDEAVTVFFRDTVLSNKVSFDYSQIAAEAAVDDFITRLRAIRDAVRDEPGGPYVVTVILDGENAWEWYENDGKAFLNGMYTELSADPTIKTVTPTEFLALYDQQPETIPDLWAGSWDSATFETWIGEPEENRAWDYLADTRAVLEDYLNGPRRGQVGDDALEQAYQAMLAAEGSDWFWWFGADRDSGNDAAFDTQFRETLGQVYDALSLERPAYLSVPIIQPTPVSPDVGLEGTFTPVIDGQMTTRSEWMDAGRFLFEDQELTSLDFGFDKDTLTLRLEQPTGQDLDIYLKVPARNDGQPFSETGQVIGMYATHRIAIRPTSGDPEWSFYAWDVQTESWEHILDGDVQFASAEFTEIAIPLASLWPTLDTGDTITVRVATETALYPQAGPGRLLLPDLGRITWVVDVSDPLNDDHGPGGYVYPGDGVFTPGVFDLASFRVGYDENSLVFRVEMRGAVENPWGAANGLSIQLIDIYIDTDGPANGARLMRNARNAAFSEAYGWDLGLSLAGWNYGFFTANAPESILRDVPVTIIADPGKRVVIAKIPLDAIPGDPATWAYAVAVLSNDGYGINGVREVIPAAEQWRLGGAPSDTNHTRIVDILWPAGNTPTQEEMLSSYSSSQGDPSSLGLADFPQLEMYRP